MAETQKSNDWYKKEQHKEKPKEITIKLNMNHLKTAGYIFLIVTLVTVIVLQQVGVIPTIGNATGSATKIFEEAETENKTPGVTIIKPNGTKIEANSTNETEEVEEEEPEEEELLPITGDIFLIIDKIDYTIKSEDYARIISVTFTIKNQDVDFEPKITGYLTAYGSDDEKTIILDELEAGYSVTEKSTKLTFGYNDIDQDQTLKLDLYRGKKLIKTTSKTFKTE